MAALFRLFVTFSGQGPEPTVEYLLWLHHNESHTLAAQCRHAREVQDVVSHAARPITIVAPNIDNHNAAPFPLLRAWSTPQCLLYTIVERLLEVFQLVCAR